MSKGKYDTTAGRESQLSKTDISASNIDSILNRISKIDKISKNSVGFRAFDCLLHIKGGEQCQMNSLDYGRIGAAFWCRLFNKQGDCSDNKSELSWRVNSWM